MKRFLVSMFWVFLTLVSIPCVLAQESGWPRTLPLDEGMVTIYALQVDEMSGDIIHFRAALAYRETADSEPVFGAGWFESRVEIDSANGIVHPTDLKVTETRFPAGTDDIQAGLTAVLALESPVWNLDFSVDELDAALKTAKAESKAVQSLNTAPPQIVYRDHPALLVSLDGPPVMREIENSPYQAVINTPYPLIFNGKNFYLNAAKGVWYRASTATGPYQFETSPPADIVAMVEAGEAAEAVQQPLEPISAANAPEIVVSTVPTELIVTEGPAAFVPLVDDLLVLQNSDDDVFMHVGSQEFYIVLAGRWYHASSLNGPWTYQMADNLPPAFANIPRDSDQAGSRVYVAGTQEARDAVLDAQVPKTTAVARGEVDIEVAYDGNPVFKPVDGAKLVYADNTSSTVILSDGWYYLVENGVWYVSSSPNGPWQVSDHRPDQVRSILPTSPVYNVKYVNVYHATPSLVYVGYTPGYYGSYVYNNTIFYGSGWYYPSWVSPAYYYPRHSTWGFNVRYNPWGGWSYGLSWGWGFFSLGYYSGGYWHHNQYWHHGHYGRWGSRGYRPRAVHYGNGHNRYARSDYRRKDYNRNAKKHYKSDYDKRDGKHDRYDARNGRLVDSSDIQRRTPTGRGDEDRYTAYNAANRNREQDRASRNRGDDNREIRVSRSDLRLKADLREISDKTRRGKYLADNSGNIYRGVDRNSNRTDVLHENQSTAIKASRRTQGRSSDNQRSQDRATDNQRSQYRSTDNQRSPARSTDNRNSQQPSRMVNSQAPQRRPETPGTDARQRSYAVASASMRTQQGSRTSPQQQNSQNRSRSNSTPKPSVAQKSTHKANNHKSRSNSGKRDAGSRHRSQ